MVSEAQESSPSSRLRISLRPVSLAVLVGVGALALAGCLATRGVVADQERKLLKQRTEEAGFSLGGALGAVQTQLSSLGAVYAANASGFHDSATLLTKAPGGFSTIAIVKPGSSPKVVAEVGKPLTTVPTP